MYRKLLYLLCASVLPLMVCSGMVYSVMSLYIRDDLGASYTQIGLVYMVGSGSGALIAPFAGRVSDRIGRRPVLLLSMIGFTAAFALYAFIGNYVEAFFVQALEGAAWAALGVSAYAFIADITPAEERGWAMGVYGRAWYVGWIAGPLLGGYLAEHVGFRLTFLAGSCLILMGLALILLYVKEPRKASSSYEAKNSLANNAPRRCLGTSD